MAVTHGEAGDAEPVAAVLGSAGEADGEAATATEIVVFAVAGGAAAVVVASVGARDGSAGDTINSETTRHETDQRS